MALASFMQALSDIAVNSILKVLSMFLQGINKIS
jgi:hypothetical protein